jgi:hypothetical protein
MSAIARRRDGVSFVGGPSFCPARLRRVDPGMNPHILVLSQFERDLTRE